MNHPQLCHSYYYLMGYSFRHLLVPARSANRGLDVVRCGIVGTIRRAKHYAERGPIFMRIQFLAMHTRLALYGGAHTGVAYNAGLLPVSNHLLLGADSRRELCLVASCLDGLLDSAHRFRSLLAHGNDSVVYKRICSTARSELQALLERLRTKCFVL